MFQASLLFIPTDCAVDFGFEVPEAEGNPIKSVCHRSRYRFSSPKKSILFLRVSSRYAELLNLKVGESWNGKVEAIQDYGLSVNIGDGLVGLVRISPQGYYKIENFEVGDEVRVRVRCIEPEHKRIAFSLLPPLS